MKSSNKGVFYVLRKCPASRCAQQNLKLSYKAAVADLGPTQEPFGLVPKKSGFFSQISMIPSTSQGKQRYFVSSVPVAQAAEFLEWLD